MCVYSHLFVVDGTIGISRWYDRPNKRWRIKVHEAGIGPRYRKITVPVSVFRSCRLIYREATPVLYGENAFRVLQKPFRHDPFLEQIGSAVRYLRRFWMCSMEKFSKDRRRSFHILAQATMLSQLSIRVCNWHGQWTSEKIAKEVGPLIRSLHKSQKKRRDRKQRNVLDILTITTNDKFCQKCRASPDAAKKYEDEVRELIAKTLR